MFCHGYKGSVDGKTELGLIAQIEWLEYVKWCGVLLYSAAEKEYH